jgi:hypothetical protein
MDEQTLRALALQGATGEYRRLRARLSELEAWFPELRRAIRSEVFAANAAKAREAKRAKRATSDGEPKRRAPGRRKAAG